jgi:D-3-phosphoglycerate dehydrogenase
MTWKVTVTARAALIGEECAVDLLEAADCEVEVVSETGPFSASQMKRILDGKDAVLAGADNFSREVLAAEESKDLKIVSRWGVGYDSVDLAAATEKGIVVAYTPGLLDDAVGEYAFTLMLTLSHHVLRHTKVYARVNGKFDGDIRSEERSWGLSDTDGSDGRWRVVPRPWECRF